MAAHHSPELHWQQIQTILDEVFELPTEQRLAFLQRACGSNPDLYSEVETLLKAERDAPAFLDRPAVELMQSFLSTATNNQRAQIPDYTARSIGSYRLREAIGRGGMGVVYRAERAEGNFDQQVAIKLLSNWQNRDLRLDRFQREQQLLASLNHPNIAQLYDGGLTEEGQPYIVMEYVQGEPINIYCDRHRLTIDARLKLTMQVVDALHYAHRNLVIHRDIKPSNILVTEDGQIKLLDFGIAKLLGEQEAADLTHTGDQLMTPGFAAPEQLRGQNVSVATDIFQLGLVLYELLTGRHAFRERAGTYFELAKKVCEQTPTRPSVIVTQRVESSDGAAQHNSFKPRVGTLSRLPAQRLAHWSKKLRGDLDAIVLKALRNEPEMRYASMEALGADIEAYFAARPVEAREKGTRYRISKFVRRNAWAVLASASVIALLIAYATTATVQAKRIQNALDQSRVEAHKAQQVSDFIIDIFKISDPAVAGIETVTARELLENSRERIHDQLEDAPEIRAQMLHVLGKIYYNLGSYDDSASLLQEATDSRRHLLPKQDPALASSMTHLGIAYRETDRYDQARLLFEEALSIYRSHDVESTDQARVLSALAQLLRKQRHYEEAETLFHDAIAMLRRVTTNSDHNELALGLKNLAMLQRVQGNFPAAETNMLEAIAMEERLLGSEHPEYTQGLRDLAGILADMERYDEAKMLSLRALEIQERVLGLTHPYTAYTLQNLGLLTYRQGQLATAEDFLRRTLSIQREVHGKESAAVARTLYLLGTVLQERGNHAEAQLLYESMLRIDRRFFPSNSPMIGRDISKLASVSHAKGDFHLAKERYQQALAILPHSALITSAVNVGYARLLLDLGDPYNAEQVARAAFKLRESRLPAGHSFTAEAQSTLGVILARMGRRNEALNLLEPAYRILDKRGRPGDIFLEQTKKILRQFNSTLIERARENL